MQPGTIAVSVSLGPLNVVDSTNFRYLFLILINYLFRMLVAVASFDECKVLFYELSFNQSNKKLVLTRMTDRELKNIHKFPVKQVRLSKKNANMLVSCGDESDLYVKLWNAATASGSQASEPVNSV